MPSIELDSNIEIQYRDLGSGPTIVCVHGGFMSKEVWDRQLAAFPHEYRVIAVDIRGHGESETEYGTCTDDQFAADLDALLKELDLRDVTYLGWSLGATIGVTYLGQYGNERLDQAIFTSTGIFEGLANEVRRRTGATDAVSENFLDFDALREHHRRNNPEAMWEFVNGLFTETTDRRTKEWLYRIAIRTPLHVVLEVIDLYATMDYNRLYEYAVDINCPVLALQGAHDTTAGLDDAAFVASEIFPDGEFIAFDDSGHLPFVEEADGFNDAVTSFVGQDQDRK